MAQQTITALYDRYEDASNAVSKLEAGGIPHGDISIVSNNEGDRHAGRAAAGGLGGALAGAGVSETDAHAYGEGVRRGGTLVTVRVDDARTTMVPMVMDVLEEHGSVDLDQKTSAWRADGWEAPAPAAGTAITGPTDGRSRVRAYPSTTSL